MAKNLNYLFLVAGIIFLIIVLFIVITGMETFGAESDPTGNPIGGGTGYSDIILPGDPKIKYTVTNYDEFASALTKTYMKGDIIYVPETASINMTGHSGDEVEIPANVTIAGNRGSHGSPGGRFFWLSSPSDSGWGYATGTMFYITTDNVRITGLRLEGPHMTTSVVDNNKERSAMDLRNGKGLEVDNCEMYGWSYAAIDIETDIEAPADRDALIALGLNSAEIGSAIANIHHNYIHHCQMDGLGYGVVVDGGTALVKANLFDYTRHAVAASGVQGEGYEASYNIHLGHSTSSVFDVHGHDVSGATKIAGDSYKIHHNTVTITNDVAVGIRGVPHRGVWIDHNRFQWFLYDGVNYSPVLQACGKGNIFMTKNMISSEYYEDLNVYYYPSCV